MRRRNTGNGLTTGVRGMLNGRTFNPLVASSNLAGPTKDYSPV